MNYPVTVPNPIKTKSAKRLEVRLAKLKKRMVANRKARKKTRQKQVLSLSGVLLAGPS
jgi:hypothetical protein